LGGFFVAVIKVAVIGANLANVKEIRRVVFAAIGGSAEIVTATIDNYKELTGADLYVCLVNRKQEVESVFGADKVVHLTLVPPTEYFLQISRIPANSSVVIFNNSTAGTNVLMKCLKRYNLMHVRYEIVPYDEWSHQQVAEKIAAAEYIIGGIAYVGEGKTLYAKFDEYLSKDTVVLLSPPRIATSESISRLSRVFSTLYHKTITDELKRFSFVDYLTQIPNRRTFDENLRLEWSRAQREWTPLSLAMIDIDFFKNYNDHYGHIAGDERLKAIAQTLKSVLQRPGDLCARYGGEEFTVILPNTDTDGARHILEKIRDAVMALQIKHEFSSVAPVVTVSVGAVTTIPANGNVVVEEMLEKADKALYQAKHQGRNRVCIGTLSKIINF
jgi:diguanylate cyclase (GGDEF)-like protein